MAASQYTHALLDLLHPDGPISQVVGGELAVPTAVAVLITGLSFLAGFALGATVEQLNLRHRERQLARGRRLLAAQARGIRLQLADYYRMRSSASVEQPTLPEVPVLGGEDRGP